MLDCINAILTKKAYPPAFWLGGLIRLLFKNSNSWLGGRIRLLFKNR
jgi:hypothetical protein